MCHRARPIDAARVKKSRTPPGEINMQFLDAAAAWLLRGFGLSIASDCLPAESIEIAAPAPPLRQKPVLRLIVNSVPVLSEARREQLARRA